MIVAIDEFAVGIRHRVATPGVTMILGESGANDLELLSLVTTANVACGFHAGDADTMLTVVRLALERGVANLARHVRNVRELYGLQGTWLEQYLSFWTRILRADFGPSLSAFPTPVGSLIGRALPWTAGLLITATVITWVLGTAVSFAAVLGLLYINLQTFQPILRELVAAAAAESPAAHGPREAGSRECSVESQTRRYERR